MVPTARHWPAWVGLMVTTYFDLVLGPFWVPRVPKRAHFGPNVPNFHGPIFVGYFLCLKYSLVGCPEHHNGKPCSSSTVAAHMEPSSLRTCIVLIRAPACYRVVHLVIFIISILHFCTVHNFHWHAITYRPIQWLDSAPQLCRSPSSSRSARRPSGICENENKDQHCVRSYQC